MSLLSFIILFESFFFLSLNKILSVLLFFSKETTPNISDYFFLFSMSLISALLLFSSADYGLIYSSLSNSLRCKIKLLFEIFIFS